MRPAAKVIDLTAGWQVLVMAEVDVAGTTDGRQSQADVRSHTPIVSPRPRPCSQTVAECPHSGRRDETRRATRRSTGCVV
jgi:hypothetical protein